MKAILITLIIGACCFSGGYFTRRVAPKIAYTEAEFEVTSYCPCDICCGKWADGHTASGHIIQPGDMFVAADRSLAFGTMVEVPGYGKVPVLDRGGARINLRKKVKLWQNEA